MKAHVRAFCSTFHSEMRNHLSIAILMSPELMVALNRFDIIAMDSESMCLGKTTDHNGRPLLWASDLGLHNYKRVVIHTFGCHYTPGIRSSEVRGSFKN